jgi:hypothetical protein
MSAGSQLAVASDDGVVRIFPLPLPTAPVDLAAAALAPSRELNAGAGPVVALADTPTLSGHLLAGGADGTIRLWNTEGAVVVRQFAHGGPLGGMSLKPDGSRLATVGTLPGVKVWNLSDGSLVAEWKGDVRIAEKLRLAGIDVAVRKQDVDYGKARVTAAEKAVEAATTEMTQSTAKLTAADKALGEKVEAVKTAIAAADEATKTAEAAGTALAQSTAAHETATKAAAAIVTAMEGTVAGKDAFAVVAASSAGDAATVEALKQLEEPRAVAARRGLDFDQVAPARLVRAEAEALAAAKDAAKATAAAEKAAAKAGV